MWTSGYDNIASFQERNPVYNPIPGGDYYVDITSLINEAADGKLRDVSISESVARLDSIIYLHFGVFRTGFGRSSDGGELQPA